MTNSVARLEIDPDRVAHMLRQEAVELLGSGSEVVLDFSAVRRIEANGVAALEELLELTESRSVRIRLESVDTNVYKVLRLVNLSQRFA